MTVEQNGIIKERVQRVFGYFRQQHELVDSLGDTSIYKTHKKLLYVAFIDALAGILYPKKGNRDRFVETIINFGNWDHAKRISLPHLAQFLRLHLAPQLSALGVYVNSQLAEWRRGKPISLACDPEESTIGTYWPLKKALPKPNQGIWLESLQHAQLLYTYRNALIHDFRAPAFDWEMPEDEKPYYLSNMSRESATDSITWHWLLIYPTVFLRQTSQSILDNLERYFVDNAIDPTEVMHAGKYWLPGLNK